tara:strand:+ start:498 stop:950 length:453 start_codon:yes stop_codon:yes gene_type:complete
MAWKLLLVALMGLAIGALLGMLILRVSRKREERRRQAARHLDVLDNLSILCRALLQEQVDSAEASIRISVLLDCLPQGIEPKVDLAAIHRLAEECGDFTRGEQRRELAPAERNRQDVARLRLEEEQGAAVHAAAQRLAGVLEAWRARVAA